MKKYIAKFTVPAEVEVTLEVEAADQQEGLVAAHDLIHNTPAQSAKVLSWDLQRARNTFFEAKSTEVAPQAPSPRAHEHECRVTFSSTRQPLAELTLSSLPYTRAYALAEEVRKAQNGPWGSAVVYDRHGLAVHHVYAERGGWELEMECADGRLERLTWLPSREEAVAALGGLLSRKDVKSAKLIDYTDRKCGPKQVRSLTWRSEGAALIKRC